MWCFCFFWLCGRGVWSFWSRDWIWWFVFCLGWYLLVLWWLGFICCVCFFLVFCWVSFDRCVVLVMLYDRLGLWVFLVDSVVVGCWWFFWGVGWKGRCIWWYDVLLVRWLILILVLLKCVLICVWGLCFVIFLVWLVWLIWLLW